MIYNPNIHHRRSIRMIGYDYSQAGLYFITICVKDRKCLFGKIEGVEKSQPGNFQPQNNQPHQKMILNVAGKIANDCWLKIPEHFPNVVLHEHIVMPNHVHGIIELIKFDSSPIDSVGIENFQPQRNEFQKIIPHSIGSIVRGFKTGVTKWYRNNSVTGAVGVENFQPLQIWQRNYYEHIIRNEQSYEQIADYIINNPENWRTDDFFNCQ